MLCSDLIHFLGSLRRGGTGWRMEVLKSSLRQESAQSLGRPLVVGSQL
jgi:hypothetical protein